MNKRYRRQLSRRKFTGLLVGVLVATPRTGIAQNRAAVRRIGRLKYGPPDTPEEMRAQAQPLRELGWVEDQNLHVERRWANNRPEALLPLALELVRANVEVMITGGPSATLAAKRATGMVPIVFRASDPVGTGLVASLARPGGNATGIALNYPELSAKNLSILKELLPGLRRVGSIGLATPYWRTFRAQYEATCRSLGLEPVLVDIATADQFEAAFAQLARQRIQALVLRGDTLVYEHRFELTRIAIERRLPTMADDPDVMREAGALVAYTPEQSEGEQRIASYVDRILRGAKPADLPVELPAKFKLVINSRMARRLGITVPQSLLLRADEVIQ